MLKVFYILVLSTVPASFSTIDVDSKRASKIISQIIENYFVHHSAKFDIILAEKASNYVSKIAAEILIRTKEQYAVRMRAISENPKKILRIHNPAVVLCSSLNQLANLLTVHPEEPEYTSILKPLNYLVFVKNISALDHYLNMHKKLIFHIGQMFHYTYFLVERKYEIDFMTVEWWTELKCNEAQLVKLNSFNKTDNMWKKALKIPDKFHNFHGCKLTMWSSVFLLPTIDILRDRGYGLINPMVEQTFQIRGSKDMEIAIILAQYANISLIRVEKAVGQRIHEISATIFYETGNYAAHRECSIAVFQHPILMMYSPAEAYTNYEKMILPFDYDTWKFLLIVFCLAFIGIFIVNQLPLRYRDLVYGRNVRLPSFNVLGTFFGIGQTKLPENNFGRILLMTFIIFCLIFRTAYQGVFFEMFTSDIRRKPPQTYADLRSRNYTINSIVMPEFDFNELILILIPEDERPRLIKNDIEGIMDVYKNMGDSSTRSAIPTSEPDVKVLRAVYTNVPKILQEVLNTPVEGICTLGNNFFSALNLKVTNSLISAGIPQYHYKYLLDFEFKALEDPPNEPKVFSIDDLNFGFCVWLISCAIAIAVFFLELLYFLLKRRIKEIIKDWIGLIFWTKFFKEHVFM